MGAAFAGDAKGSADHPLLPRYEGSEIVHYSTEAFTEYRLMTAPAKAYGGIAKNLDASLALEGKLTRITYRAPVDRSVLEVFRNYENALKEKGFESVYSCTKDACGGRNFNAVMAAGPLYMLFGEYQAEQRYLAAKLSRPVGDIYAVIYAVLNKSGGGPNKNRVMLQLDMIEMKPMEEKMVVLAADEMKAGITTDGRVAVYGILFDFDKADIRPDSKPQLEQIAKFLKGDTALEVRIVGHTDSKGGLDYNRDLSEKRASAVVKALTGQYGIAAKRLTPVGVGMAAPVATNRTEEGRAKNRRVELVER
jgi:outer membrane protein OmpA-like peptidoglycan-associated protein